MLLWIVIALLTAAAILAVLIPLARAPALADSTAPMARVYRDQLAELERDKAEGRIGSTDAEAARIEIARRLLATKDDPGSIGVTHADRAWPRRSIAVVALAGIPALSLSLYLLLGSPTLPGLPLADRLSTPSNDVETLVAQVEKHLATSPEDGRGWEVIAPVYFSLGRAEDAVRAYANAIRLLGSSARLQTGLGGAIVAAQGGVVTAEARAAFEAASKLDQTAPEPRYFLGLAAQQEGKKDEAAAIWQALLAETPADAAWRAMLEQSIASLEGNTVPTSDTAAAPGPSDADIAAAAGMSENDRAAMIEGMVGSLAAKLKDEPNDVEGWLKLIRSYVVLGRADAAAEAARTALEVLPDPEKRGRVESLIADLGITPAGSATP